MLRSIVTLVLLLSLICWAPAYAASGLSVELDTQLLDTVMEVDNVKYIDGDGNATRLRATYQFNDNWSAGLDYTWIEANDDLYPEYYPVTLANNANLFSAQVQYTFPFSNRFRLGLQAGYQRFDLQEVLYGYKFEGDLDGFFLGLKSDLAFTPNFGLVAGYRVMVDPSVDLNLSSFAEGNFFNKDEGFQEFDIAAYYNINANSTLKLGYHAIRADFDVGYEDTEYLYSAEAGTYYKADYKARGFYVGLQHRF